MKLLVYLTFAIAYATSAIAADVSVFFSPNGGCEAAVIHEVDAAKSEILVQAYSFTSKPIADALIAAHKRGVDVQIICDKGQRGALNSQGPVTLKAGIPTTIDAKHAIAHQKSMAIDGHTVIEGSFNFTNAAEHNNSECLVVIRDKDIAEKYTANWKVHAEHSDPWGARAQNRRTR